MASVRKLKPDDPKSPWIVEYTGPDGKRHRKTPKTGLKKDAETLRHKIEREMSDGKHVAASQSVTIEKLCDEYVKWCEDRVRDQRIGRRHLDHTTSVVDTHIVPRLGGRKASDIRRSDIDSLYTSLCRSGRVIPRSAKAYLQTFKLIFDYAARHGWVVGNPCKEFLGELRGIPRPKIRTFTKQEVGAVLAAAAAPKRWRCTGRWDRLLLCMVSTAAFCGLRYGEVTGLLLSNIDLETRTIRVRTSLTYYGDIKPPKTKAGVRDVPIPAPLVRMFSDWLARDWVANDKGLVFTQRNGTFIGHRNFYRQQWMPLLQRAGLEEVVRFHALRHFCASWMVDKGIPITEVARLLGHNHFDMTLQTYAHPLLDAARQYAIVDAEAEGLLALSATSSGGSTRQNRDVAA